MRFNRLLLSGLGMLLVLGGCNQKNGTPTTQARRSDAEKAAAEGAETSDLKQTPPAKEKEPPQGTAKAAENSEPSDPVKRSAPAKQTKARAPSVARKRRPKKKTDNAKQGTRGAKRRPSTPSIAEAKAELHVPRVQLSVDHSRTCVVKVGDQMPMLQVADPEGRVVDPMSGPGRKLTLVVFWSLETTLSREQVSRLQPDVVMPFAGRGVKVVAINVGDNQADVRDFCEAHSGAYAWFRDADGTCFQKVAKRKLPRMYLLDSTGRILWFDIEYSRSASRELNNAIEYFLQKKPTG